MSPEPAATIEPTRLRERLPVDRRHLGDCPSLDNDYLGPTGRPVVLVDAMSGWPALEKWTFEFFAARARGEEVEVAERFFGRARRFTMAFDVFLTYCRQRSILSHVVDDDARLYCAYQPFSVGSDLLHDFWWPPVLQNLYASLEGAGYDWYLRTFGVLLVGPAGTITPLHVDMFSTHAWLAQLTGRKRVLFFSADEIGRLLARSGQGVALVDGRPAGPGADGLEKMIDLSDACAYEVLLNPGEMVVFPQGWYHHVTSLDPSISLSFNFVNQHNFATHMLATMRDLPRWLRRLNRDTALRERMGITWGPEDLV